MLWSSVAAAQPTQQAQQARCETTRCVDREDTSVGEALLWLPRAVLRIPRLALDASLRLLVLGARVEERYQIADTVNDLLFNDDRTFGIVPTAFYETGFSPSIGARVIHRDLLGQREGMELSALFAGVEQQRYGAELRSGKRLGSTRLSLSGGYDRYDNSRFYGLGNADQVDRLGGARPRSAFERSVAVGARYRSEQARGIVNVSQQLAQAFSIGATLQLRRRELSTGDEQRDGKPWVDSVFTAGSLTGLNDTRTDAYSELLVAWDDRRIARRDLPLALPSNGWRLATWAGTQTWLDGANGTFGRLGGDVQRFIDLAHGDRVLRLRLRTAWAVGALRTIAFPDLPSLGGSRLLRGYPSGRFRDRGSLLATVEYRYPVQDNLAAYLFVDAGRVLDTLSDVSPSALRAARVGFGAGIIAFSIGGLWARAQLASSIDGGLYLHLLLDATDAQIQTI